MKDNKEMSILKAIGAISVVIGHIYAQLYSVIRQPYMFHMPLFYFISGYFYNEDHEQNKKLYIWKKFKKNIILFYFYYIIFILFGIIIKNKYKIILGEINFHNFFIQPFTDGSMGFLIQPAWFVVSLFIIQTFFILIYPIIKKYIKNEYKKLLFFLCLGILGLILDKYKLNKNEYILFLTKTMIGLFWYYLGLFYKKNIENKINIFNIQTLFCSLLILSTIVIMFPSSFLMDVRIGNYNGHVLLPIIEAIIGIYISILISKGIALTIKDKHNMLSKIGENSYYIMILNFPINFLISFIFFHIFKVDTTQWQILGIPIVGFKIHRTWPIYIFSGVLLPVIYGEIIFKIKKLTRNNHK